MALSMAFALLVLPACGATTGRPPAAQLPAARVTAQSSPGVVLLEPTLVSPEEAVGLSELFRRADEALDGAETERARQLFEQALLLAADEEERARALLGVGTSYDLEGEEVDALEFYSRVSSGSSALREQAGLRCVRLLVHLERYGEAGQLASELSLEGGAPPDGRTLPALARLTLEGARALDLATREPLDAATRDEAQRKIGEARVLIEELGYDRLAAPPVEVAVVFFALGELTRQESLAIQLDANSTSFSAELEQRCRFLLDAQAAYSEVMRSGNAHWSAMAGVRVGALYAALHRDLMTMGTPAAAETQEQVALYWGASRLRYGILLRKAVKMLETTIEMVDRTTQVTRYRQLAVDALAELRRAQAVEEAVIAELPYSREQLHSALEDLSRRTGGAGEI